MLRSQRPAGFVGLAPGRADAADVDGGQSAWGKVAEGLADFRGDDGELFVLGVRARPRERDFSSVGGRGAFFVARAVAACFRWKFTAFCLEGKAFLCRLPLASRQSAYHLPYLCSIGHRSDTGVDFGASLAAGVRVLIYRGVVSRKPLWFPRAGAAFRGVR